MKIFNVDNKDKRFLLSSLLCLVPIIIGVFLYGSLPDQIPTHWDINGNVDDYSSKAFALFGLPLFMFFIDLLTKFLIINDPKKRGHNSKLLSFYKYMLPILTTLIFALQILEIQGLTSDRIVIMGVYLFIGVMFIIIGNYLPKVKQNYVLGVKTSWALNDEDNWNKTHRIAGPVMVISGFIYILLAFIDFGETINLVLLVSSVVIMVVVPYGYSYKLYLDSKEKNNHD